MPGKGKVLLMDDEQIILDVTSEILTFLKYDVMSAKDGLAAVDLYRKEKDAGAPFDIVILDLSVPAGLGGKETIELLRKVDPAVKAVVSSGYIERSCCRRFFTLRFLRKTYKTLQH